MRCYHTTAAPDAIMQGGFRDATDDYMIGELRTGVWLADRPLGIMDGTADGAVVCIDVPDELFAEYEWIKEGKGYREALIPASLVNRHGPARIADDAGE